MDAAEEAVALRPTDAIQDTERRELVSAEALRERVPQAGRLKATRLCIAAPAAYVRLSGIAIKAVAAEQEIQAE